MRDLYSLADANWQAFIDPVIRPTPGHLVNYPIHVNQDGRQVAKPMLLCATITLRDADSAFNPCDGPM